MVDVLTLRFVHPPTEDSPDHPDCDEVVLVGT